MSAPIVWGVAEADFEVVRAAPSPADRSKEYGICRLIQYLERGEIPHFWFRADVLRHA